jgi:3-methyladenine DNA glycosylase AlkC
MQPLKEEPDIDWIRNRTPATRIVEIPEQVKQSLSKGLVATKNLTEWLASDRQKLLSTVIHHLGLGSQFDPQSIWTDELLSQSALKHSFAIGQWLSLHIQVGSDNWSFLASHESDIVREWAAILVGLSTEMKFPRKLAWIKPLADDEHSGLREIAWLALRSDVIRDPMSAIKSLTPWAGSRRERLRRFASEVTRPRGVWCSHLSMLKDNPELGLPILEPLLADDSKYVQNSVGNWLNDASKSQPDWVRMTTQQWLKISDSPNTRYIVKRASRTLERS